MAYVEERELTFRIEARCTFPDDYEGESDGFAWVPEFQQLAGEMLRSLVAAVRAHPQWKVHPANRGRSSEDEVTLVVERALGATE
ncbi:MAG TPA: hypothetical protein VFF06_28620 [Polyangia bacterium]|nr:hypothetical protein [Polyangia bacterium]